MSEKKLNSKAEPFCPGYARGGNTLGNPTTGGNILGTPTTGGGFTGGNTLGTPTRRGIAPGRNIIERHLSVFDPTTFVGYDPGGYDSDPEEQKVQSPTSDNKDTGHIDTTTIRLTTFNVLSSKLCSPQWFTACDKENLKPQQRFTRLLDWMEKEIKERAVLCLQEVPQEWVGPLYVFFCHQGYRFLPSNYGNAWDGYMGIGIAWPTEMTLVEADLYTLSDLWPQPKEPDTYQKARQRFNDMMGTVVSWVSDNMASYFQSLPDHNWQVKRRKNTMISLKLSHQGRDFWVGNYHMPCAFTMPEVMNIHAALAAQRLQKLAGLDPCILAGDFNLKPKDQGYFLIREGGIGDYDLPPLLNNWSPRLKRPMRSAYKEFHGTEPDFTNWAVTRGGPAFIDTLDYIFLSHEWKIMGVPLLPQRSDIMGPLPNKNIPSDHLPLTAVLGLK